MLGSPITAFALAPKRGFPLFWRFGGCPFLSDLTGLQVYDFSSYFISCQQFVNKYEATKYLPESASALFAIGNAGVWLAKSVQTQKVRVLGYHYASRIPREFEMYFIFCTEQTNFDDSSYIDITLS
jgi:hypothetical protein